MLQSHLGVLLRHDRKLDELLSCSSALLLLLGCNNLFTNKWSTILAIKQSCQRWDTSGRVLLQCSIAYVRPTLFSDWPCACDNNEPRRPIACSRYGWREVGWRPAQVIGCWLRTRLARAQFCMCVACISLCVRVCECVAWSMTVTRKLNSPVLTWTEQ